jgi:hypothetical protein
MTFNVRFADADRVLKNQPTKRVLNFRTSIFDFQIVEIRDFLPLFNFSLVPGIGISSDVILC